MRMKEDHMRIGQIKPGYNVQIGTENQFGLAQLVENWFKIQYQMIQSFDDNTYYEVDFQHGGVLRHDTLVEAVLSPDSDREKINLYLPVKKRLPDPGDIEQIQQIESVTFAEIEQANPILKEYPVDFYQMTPIYNPHYRVLDNGEAEFICWISARMLNGYGADEGSLWFSYNNHTFCINAENNSESSLSKHAILFDQLLMGNRFIVPGIGNIKYDEYNTLSWIIGERHFSVMINGEVRYCGVNLPYMNMDLHLQQPAPIFIGSNGQGKKLLRSIQISQLKSTPKINVKKGALVMEVKASNNRLPKIHPMITPHYGENYWFNGCASFVMECLGEPDYDYWFFSGLTGDNFTQVYSHHHFRGDGVTDYRLSEKGNHSFIEEVFEKCGYASSFVPLKQILNNREMYVQTMMAYMDKGIPVIFNDHGNNPHNRHGWGVLLGYEDYGKTLLYMGGDATEPDRISLKDMLPEDYIIEGEHCKGWLFLGEKKNELSLADIYRNRILSLPDLLTFENNHYSFGAKAFRAWADSIETGYFEGMKPEEYDDWGMHKVYVCNLATNSGGCRSFLEVAQKLNPDLIFIEQILALYRQTGYYWNDQNGEDLEALGGGFNANLDTLQDKDKRTKIAAKIRDFSVCIDQVVALVNDFKHKVVVCRSR